MLLDWFTVVAQALNFLILVWLLKHFLYQPILDAIDGREHQIATKLAEAEANKIEARKEREEFRQKTRRLNNGGRPYGRRSRTRPPRTSAASQRSQEGSRRIPE